MENILVLYADLISASDSCNIQVHSPFMVWGRVHNLDMGHRVELFVQHNWLLCRSSGLRGFINLMGAWGCYVQILLGVQPWHECIMSYPPGRQANLMAPI